MVTNSSGLNFENGMGGVLVVRVGATDLGHNYYSETFSIQLIDDRAEDDDGDGVSQAMEEDVFVSSDQAKDDYITLDADGDGIPALTEYAFGLNPRVADAGKYVGAPGTTAGLPGMLTFDDSQGRPRLRLEFLRRTGSGLTYVPQFSSNLKTWAQSAQAALSTRSWAQAKSRGSLPVPEALRGESAASLERGQCLPAVFVVSVLRAEVGEAVRAVGV